MLNETINEIKNQNVERNEWSPLIKLGFSFNIPENYITNIDTRMNIYRKISNINDIDNPLVIKLIDFLNADKDRAILSPK